MWCNLFKDGKKERIFVLDTLYTHVYNVYMNTNDYMMLRVRKDAHKKLRIISALSEESMLATLDRMITQEYDRLQRQQEGKPHDASVQKD